MEAKQRYKEDLATIYETIDGNRNNLEPFWKIFVIYGIVNLGFWIMQFVGDSVIMSQAMYGSIILSVSRILVIVIMGVVIFQNYRKMNRNTNRYYKMSLLLYGVFITVIPLIFEIIPYAAVFRANNALSFDAQNSISMVLVQLETITGVFLFMFSLILVGYISKKKSCFVLAILHLAIYLFLYVISGEIMYGIFSVGYYAQYYMLTQIFGYIILGIYVKKQCRNGV